MRAFRDSIFTKCRVHKNLKVMYDKNEIKSIIYAGVVILVPMIMILIYLILR